MNEEEYSKLLRGLFNLFILTLVIFLIYGIILKLTGHSPKFEELLGGASIALASLYLNSIQKSSELRDKHLEQKMDLKFDHVSERMERIEKQMEYRFSRIEKKLGIV